MGDADNSFSIVNPVNAAFVNNRITQDVDMVTLRFDYRFGGYGAPIADPADDRCTSKQSLSPGTAPGLCFRVWVLSRLKKLTGSLEYRHVGP